ncbi:AraC family transcriptional regulator [Cohaesibacter sp. ES.047]|uniref:helix-turn-helix domain-containing protein n=1 Tax=Cohaesibacter sp. ES.047 TaxID=1798205 RepID=UPI000BB7415D|nr:AraC family transcriptional regulator [Cohaesibacter sp. ES.047]SNY93715.1 AraC family transcriptional regulator [Cohaesibacter sp. ES.047]
MTQTGKSVFGYLKDTSAAVQESYLDLGFGRYGAIWTNAKDHVRYEKLEGHTFSWYARGGQGVFRVDGDKREGRPGAFCIFPQGQTSEWDITGPLEMMHLYLPSDELRRCYSEMLDRDGQLLDLADVTYADAGDLARAFAEMLVATRTGQSLRAEEAMTELVAGVLKDQRFHGLSVQPLRGGLSGRVRRQLTDYIEANLDQVIRLQDLAAIAGLSEFHLQRAFKQTCGVSPHSFASHRRVERAKLQIRQGAPLIQVSDACGFSSQSHFTRSFKAGTGVTPAAYRKAVA